MRWLKGAVVLAALGVGIAQVASARVPAFVRQTGLVCNQCHVTWTPTPDLTFTAVKFRMNGYRTPWVAEKIEAGQEGALGGRRLLLGVTGYLSYHMRSNLFQQSKGASDPTLAGAHCGSRDEQSVLQPRVGLHRPDRRERRYLDGVVFDELQPGDHRGRQRRQSVRRRPER